jgi:hypothetical protein
MPQAVTAVASSDHQVAEAAVSGGSIVNDHVPVYVVLVTGGTFTSLEAPPGVPAPTGIALTLTIDAQTFDGLDSGIMKYAPDLRQIDPNVVDLLAE